MMSLRYEPATNADSGILSGIAKTSKQNWGYSNEQMHSWNDDLTLTPDYISKNHVVKIFNKGELIGFYAIITSAKTELDHLWLTPQNMRRGFGSEIFRHIREHVSKLGKSVFHLIAEPNAKGFYEKMNGVVTGRFESKIPGRFLEIYEFTAHPH